MKPLFVHVHIYYVEMWDELKQCLLHLGSRPYDLFVSLVENSKELVDDIRCFNEAAVIQVVPNRGFDVAPFVHFVNQINVDDYSYVIKLHSKSNIKKKARLLHPFGYADVSGANWRNYLLSFIESPMAFDQHLSYLESHSSVGMLSNYKLIVSDDMYVKKFLPALQRLVAPLELADVPFTFVAGTMFIARASLFQQLQQLKIQTSDFEEVTDARDEQFAHLIERYLGWMVYSQGYVIDSAVKLPLLLRIYYRLKLRTQPLRRFIYQTKRTKSGNFIVKICKIPVFLKSQKR